MKFNSWKILLLAIAWIPVLLFWMIYSSKKRLEFFRFFSRQQSEKILNVRGKTIVVKRILIFMTLAFFTVAAARPLIGGEEVNSTSSGIDIAVIFDVSLSMKAEDENGPRFEKGKMMMIDVLNSLGGDRVAIIPFSGAAFLQLPLTDDYETLQTVVSSLEPGMIEKHGTALGTAIELASETLKASPDTSEKLAIVISDGEDPSLDFEKMSRLIKEQNIHLAVLPLGSEEGAPIRIGDSYLKDKNNQTVITKINRGFFEKCFSALGAVEIKRGETISSYIKNFKKATRDEQRTVNIYKERFQIPLLFGIIVFLIFQLYSLGKGGGKS